MKNSKDLVYKILIPAEVKDAGFLPQEAKVCGCALVSTEIQVARTMLLIEKPHCSLRLRIQPLYYGISRG